MIRSWFMEKMINYIKNNIRYLIVGIIILIIIICIPIILSIINKNKIENIVNKYINTLKLGNYEESLKYLDKDYDYSNIEIDIYYDDLVDFYSKFSVEIEKINVKNDYAIVTLKLKNPSIAYLLDNNFKLQMIDRNYSVNYFKSLLNGKSLEYEEGNAQLNLRKINNKWKILNDICFENFLNYGVNGITVDFDELIRNKKNDMETKKYITDFIKIIDYKIEYVSSHNFSNKLSLYDIEVVNNGNRDIRKMQMEVTFLNEGVKRTINLIDYYDSEFKAESRWKSPSYKYYNLDSMSKTFLTNTDKNNIQLKVINIAF